jgi:hypothetical protein
MPRYGRGFKFKCKFKYRFGRLKAFGTLARWGGASGYSST